MNRGLFMIGNRIKEIRKEANLTQQELSDGIITRSYLSQIEKEIVQPSLEVLAKLSSKLNCSVDDFFKKVEDKKLLLVQIKKDIKNAEMNLNNNLFDKIDILIQKKEYLNLAELDHYYKGILYWIHGKYQEKNKDYHKAISFYNKSITLFEDGNHSEEILRSLDSLGYVTSHLNENEKALNILHKAYRIMIYQQISGIVRISVLANLGIIHGKLNEYYSAINYLQEARDLNDHVGTYYKSGEIFMALGVCNMELNRYTEAKNNYERALKYFKLNENKESEAGTYTNLGILFLYQKDYDLAELHLKTAIEIYESINAEARTQMNARIGLSQVYYSKDKLNKASIICFDILKFKEVNKYTAEAYELLGDISQKQEDIDSSLSYYKESKKILIESSLPSESISIKIAGIYSILGEYEQAVNYYKKSIK